MLHVGLSTGVGVYFRETGDSPCPEVPTLVILFRLKRPPTLGYLRRVFSLREQIQESGTTDDEWVRRVRGTSGKR